MKKLVDLFLIGCVIGGAVWTYQIKHKADRATRNLAKIENEIRETRNHIGLLRADFELLSSPSRLATISGQFSAQLELQQAEPSQFATLDELPPFREVAAAPAEGEATGSITDLLKQLEPEE